jgi:multidrug efflux pump subunit AcrB
MERFINNSLNKRAITYFMTAILVFGGLFSYFSLNKLEDPTFTVKTAIVVAQYPGADAKTVQEEVTQILESKIQEVSNIKSITSESRQGLAIISVELQDEVPAGEVNAVWTRMRYKVADAKATLPQEVKVQVRDDFGDVYGFVIAMTGAGFSERELHSAANQLKKRLSVLDGVARVEFWGERQEAVFIEVSEARLAAIGLPPNVLLYTLQVQNAAVDAGFANYDGRRVMLDLKGTFNDIEAVKDFLIPLPQGGSVPLGDVADVSRGYYDPPVQLMFFNGEPAIGLSIAATGEGNIGKLGRRLQQEIDDTMADIPIGIEVHKIAWQSDLVDASIKDFMASLIAAVVIVLVLLWFSMGRQMAVVIGTGLILTILLTFIAMLLLKIDMHRVSLGALIVALGMMVDNSIVVAEGIYVRMQHGMNRQKAAVEAAAQPSLPLLGATIIAFMSFFAVYYASGFVGEYVGSLFLVIAISLGGSWIISMTLTPLQCLMMLKPKIEDAAEEGGESRFRQKFGHILEVSLAHRYLVLFIALGGLALAFILFTRIDRQFFPTATRPQAMIDIWTPEGSNIMATAAYAKKIEEHITATYSRDKVTSVAGFVGQGGPRFYLPVSPEMPRAAYGQLVVNFSSFKYIDAFIKEMRVWLDENMSEITTPVKRYPLGPGKSWDFELRLSGPENVDDNALRAKAEELLTIVRNSPYTETSQIDWRNKVMTYELNFDQKSSRMTGVGRNDVGLALKRNNEGIIINALREGDVVLPIIARSTQAEQSDLWNIDTLPVFSSATNKVLPLGESIKNRRFVWTEGNINQYNRRETITIEANPVYGSSVNKIIGSVKKDIAKVELPEGYTLEWGGETESSETAVNSIVPGLVPTIFIIVLILVLLFNNYRIPLVIITVIPFAFIGVAIGLFISGRPFGFMALVGTLSLIGLMIKNSIVLLDQINHELADGKTRYQATIDAAISRFRPVVLAAASTVLGVIPLLPDVFWSGLAVAIMAGLTVGTALTMILVPCLYAMFYSVKKE